MSEFTLLSKNQVWGRKRLDIFKKRGTKSAITDFAILLNGDVIKETIDGSDYRTNLEKRAGIYWTRTRNERFKSEGIRCFGYTVGKNASRKNSYLETKNTSIRPIISFSSIDEIPTNGVSPKRAEDGVLEVEYGYYPQNVTSINMEKTLERELEHKRVKATKNKYNFYVSAYCEDKDSGERKWREVLNQAQEYEYNGKRYVRFDTNDFIGNPACQLSNGRTIPESGYVWLEVLPVKWLIDEKEKVMVSEKLIVSGVPFEAEIKENPEGRFDKSFIKCFMDEHLSKDLEQSRRTITLGKQTEGVKPRKTRLERLNPDKTKEQDRAKMTDTEIIKNWIDAGESVLLRGPSGIGKTDRIKSLYPDLIYMKLTNNMFPEKVVG